IGHPEIFPLLLTAKTQEIFQCQPDKDVTEENCFKCIKKEDIIQDLKTRAKTSDFLPLKKVILEYPGEEVLVVFDPHVQYGQNFYIVASEEAKEDLLKPPVTGEETEEENKEETPEGPRPWISLGSEKEVEEESLKERDTKIKFKISRVRRKFGAPITFTDRNASDDKDSYAECASYKDETFSIKMLERDVGLQIVPKVRETSTQTKWTYPKNASTQYFTRQLSNEAKAESLSSKMLEEFLTSVHIRMEIALQQNEIMDVFFDDWKALTEDESSSGGKPDVYLKAYHSYTDEQYLKNRTISCIHWHPTIFGIIALSARQQPAYEEQVNLPNKSLLHQSVILLWSFFYPVCPQLILMAPEDIYCFEFSPSDPNVIAGGCVNGQVVLWDISKHKEKLQNTNPVVEETTESTEDELIADIAGVTEPSVTEVQENNTEPSLVRYCVTSSTQYSHKKPVTDIHWLPRNFKDNQKGGTLEKRDENCLQLVTCSPDCSLLFWDIPSIKYHEKSLSEKIKEEKRSHMPPDTHQNLDLSWKPLIKINLRESDTNTEYGPTRINLRELQYCYKKSGKPKYMSALQGPTKEKPYTEMSTSSSKNLEVLEDISTEYFVGNEDGEIVYSDWKMKTDTHSAKPHSQKYNLHIETINTLQKSPFFEDIFLSIGGQKFAIWKEGVTNGPILQSSCSAGRYTAGQWSSTRPGVFFIGRDDGNIDIWDLLKKTHEPSYFQKISKSIITFISPCSASAEQHLLAVSDNLGVLHILEICQTLSHPLSNEEANILGYFEREVKYLKYCEQEFKEYQKFQAKTKLK
ncbi:WDR63 protein, partial [Pardalotus punctatus]|nr:WDR63 protein [Pardalotus punctatus]